MFAVIKMELSGKAVYGPVLKTTQLSTRAFFALHKLNVRHISTSGLVDLLTEKVCHVCAPRDESFHQV